MLVGVWGFWKILFSIFSTGKYCQSIAGFCRQKICDFFDRKCLLLTLSVHKGCQPTVNQSAQPKPIRTHEKPLRFYPPHFLGKLLIVSILLFVFSCRERQEVEPDTDLGIAQVQQWYENQHSSIRNGSLLDMRQSASGRTRKVINPDWRYAEHKTDGKGQSFWLIPINSAAEYNLGGIGFRNLLIRKGENGRAEAYVAEMIGEGEYLKRKNNKIDPKDFTGQVTLYYTDKEGIHAAGRFENGKNLYFGFTDSTASKEAAESKGGRVSGNVIKSCETRTYCDPTATPAQNSCNCNAAQTSYVGSTIQETNNAIPFSLNNCRTYERCDYYYYRTSYQNSGDYYNNPYGGGGSGGSSGGGTVDPVPQWLIDYIKWQQEELITRRITNVNQSINTAGLSPCIQNVVNDIQKLSSKSTVGGIINKFCDGLNKTMNWNLADKSLPAGQYGATSQFYNTATGEVTTFLDPSKYQTATTISVARTILHESIHAYLIALSRTDPTSYGKTYTDMINDYSQQKFGGDGNAIQHEEFVRDFRISIAKALQEFGESKGYSHSQQFYSDMAWGGLQGTTVFQKLQISDQKRINNVVEIELTNYDTEGNLKKQSGVKAGC